MRTLLRQPDSLNNNTPVLLISWDPLQLHITAEDASEELGRNKPRIAVAIEKTKSKPGEPVLTTIRINAGTNAARGGQNCL
ncbi:MAG: hypothetical protein WDM78_14680 [Puia sp.]